MERERIQQILSAPVCYFLKSTEEEKALFPDKQGWFYTAKLASGQRFVAHMDSDKDAIEVVFTLRPLNHLLPDLKEVQWIESPFFDGHGVATICQLANGAPESEKEVYESALESKPTQVLGRKVYQDNSLFKRLSDVRSLRLSCEESKNRLFTSQRKLKTLEISDEKRPVQQLLNLNNERN